MTKDFFGSLGETLTKTARELSDRAEEVYETQRLKNKISGEERQITKAMADIGKIIYKRYRDGVPLAEEEKAICEQIEIQGRDERCQRKQVLSFLWESAWQKRCVLFQMRCGLPEPGAGRSSRRYRGWNS